MEIYGRRWVFEFCVVEFNVNYLVIRADEDAALGDSAAVEL